MYSVISEIDSKSIVTLESLRQKCAAACNLETPAKKWPFHLSWQGAQSYALAETENRVHQIASLFLPITIKVDGIGIFTGEEPVLYLTIIRTPQLTALNQTLWEALQPLSDGMNLDFSPDEWLPHISFIYGGPKIAPLMSCVVEKMIPMDLEINVRLDNISLVYFHEEESGIVFQYPFTGKD